MKTRTEEIDELLLKYVDILKNGKLEDFYSTLNKIVKLEIEKHDILKNIS